MVLASAAATDSDQSTAEPQKLASPITKTDPPSLRVFHEWLDSPKARR
jgi:hypothetical protein